MPATSRKPAKKRSPPQPQTATTPESAGNGSSSSSNQQSLRELYSSLLKLRLLQEQVSGELAAGYDLAIGHEAVTAGATSGLRAEDTIVASHRNLAALIARGIPLKALWSHAGSIQGVIGSITRASLPEDPFHLATGIALSRKLEKKQNIVVAFCNPEALRLDPWHDALKFAAGHRLPVVYVIASATGDENSDNQAPHLKPVSFTARHCGLPGIIVDGQDVVAVWRVAQESIHRARNGSGPTLIDCRTDRARDPLAYMEHYLRKRELWNEGYRRKLEAQIKAEIG